MLSRLGAMMELPARLAPSSEAHPGQLGPYRLIERLGSGGQATVYRARRVDERDEGDVAIKRLHPHLADDPRELRSFAREARIAYLLDHPVIRRVFAMRRDRGEVFLVMEYVDGVSVRDVLKRANSARRLLPLAGSLAVIHRLCSALHDAHELLDELAAPAGIVHRDISPSNLIVSVPGKLKLIDLGIAKSASADHATNSGQIKGKYAYMAPEVLDGATFDRRADIFSIGVLAWELLAAQKLFAVSHPPHDLERARARPIDPPSRRNPACSTELDAVILRALAADPAARWSTCAAMADALEAIAAREGHELTDSALAALAREPRQRLARGTPSGMPLSPTLPTVVLPAAEPPPRRTPKRALLIATCGMLALVAVAIVVGMVLPVATTAPPAAVRVDAAVLERPASPAVADAVPPPPPPPPSPPSAPPPSPPAEGMPLAVDASKVERLAGDAPRSRSSSGRYRARVCIGTAGEVLSVTVLEGLARLHARIERTLARWRYRPYRDHDGLRPVCFDVEDRLQRIARD